MDYFENFKFGVFFYWMNKNKRKMKVKEVMTKFLNLITCEATASVQEICTLMSKNHISFIFF
jgi:CBS domain-containing protein